MASSYLTEQLLAKHNQPMDAPLHREAPTPASICPVASTRQCSAGSQSTCPPSFKATMRRKSKAFIASERSNTRYSFSADSPHAPEAVDSRLANDADDSIISRQVAFLVVRHIEEAIADGLELSPQDDDFHEAHFLHKSCCHRCCPRRLSNNSAECHASNEKVLKFITDIASSLYFCKQVVVLCAIYIERLLDEAKEKEFRRKVYITHGNWRTMVVVGLLLASKVWEDVHPWNTDFEQCLVETVGVRYAPGALYKIESLFLDKLLWRVFVDAKEYASYYFSLLDGGGKNFAGMRPTDNDDGLAFYPRRWPTRRRVHTDVDIIPAINEDEVLHTVYERVGESDMERESLSTPRTASLGDLWDAWDSDGSDVAMRKLSVASWQQSILDGGEDQAHASLTSSALREAWRLDASNPHLGALRHAPRASAPSRHIVPSAEMRWASQLASRTAGVLGPRRFKNDKSVNTISGATGAWLNSELQRHRAGIAVASAEGGSASQSSTAQKTLADISFSADDAV